MNDDEGAERARRARANIGESALERGAAPSVMRASRFICAAASGVESLLQEASGRVCERLTPEVASSLTSSGYAVIDGLYGSRFCSTLRSEVRSFFPSRGLSSDTSRGLDSSLAPQRLHHSERVTLR